MSGVTPSPRAQTVIGLLCPGTAASAGGIGRFAVGLMAELRSRHPAFGVTYIDTRGSRHILAAPWFFACAIIRICGLRLTTARVVLHVNVASYGSALRKFVVVAVASVLGVPVVLHVHGGLFETFYARLPASLRWGVRWMFRRAECVVVLGTRMREFAVGSLGVPSNRVEVIANGARLPTEPMPLVGESSRAPLILFLGRLGRLKGVDELVTSLAAPPLLQQPWQAVLAGDGDPARYLAAARRLGIADRVAFPGWQDGEAVQGLLRQAAILVLPSYAEGLPMVVVEALAHKVPVVATPVGALPDYLVHEQSVLFVEPGNEEALSAALHRVLTDSTLRQRLREQGHAVFRREFDIAVVADRFADLYVKAANGCSAASARAAGVRHVA